MTNRRIHSFLILLLIISPLFAAAGPLSQFSLGSGTNHIVATIYRPGQASGGTEVLSFRSSADGKLLWTMNSEGFEKPVLFSYHGENFVLVSTTPAGSGGFVSDTVFWIAPDATMHEIDFEDAAGAYEKNVDAQEMVLAGGSGVNCTGGRLTFEFYIANDGDPHCCPTAGKVTGNYEIVGKPKFNPLTKHFSSTFRMVATQYSRTPIFSSEMTASLAR